MKRIIILCDGTWSTASSKPTNVLHLSRALRPFDSDGISQVPVYVPGVGTGRRGVTAVSRKLDKVLGGTMGLGLMDNVVEAYQHLTFLYEQGDEIYIFGYSRGAFTARSLAGLIRSTGIIPRGNIHFLPDALDRYRRRNDPRTHPRSSSSQAFRLKMSPHLYTSDLDKDVWEKNAKKTGIATPEQLKITYLGVWDTVGALGVPPRLKGLSKLWNRGYGFHDTELSSIVHAARHAVALDERRREFEPTCWTNLDILNAARDGTPYQELHFAGDHGAVGGGGPIRHLSNISLSWVMDGAAECGLSFDPGQEAEIKRTCNAVSPYLTNSEKPLGGGAAILRRIGRDRPGPDRFDRVHQAALDRYTFETKDGAWTPYRPGSLRRIEPDLRDWLDARVAEPQITRVA